MESAPSPSFPARARAKLGELSAWVDHTAERLASVSVGWLFWPALSAIGLGAGGFAITHPDKLGALDTNKLTDAGRKHAIVWVLAAAAVIGLVHLAVIVQRRVRTGSWQVVHAASAANRWLVGLCALPFVAALRRPGIEADSTKLALACAAAAAIFVGRVAYELEGLDDPEAEEPPSAKRDRLFDALAAVSVAAIGGAFAIGMGRLAILAHQALGTHTADLGVYENVVWQTAHGHPLACSFFASGTHLSAHVDPILVLLAPFHRLYPHPELLLGFQAAWVASGVVPAYLLARRELGRAAGVVLAAAWALHPSIQGLCLDEFHSLSLAAPLFAWLALALSARATKGYLVALALALACREDVAIVLVPLGLVALAAKDRPARTLGAVTVVASLAWYVVARLVVARATGLGTAGPDAAPYEATWEAMIPEKNGLGGLALSIIENPAFAVKTAFAEPKVDGLLTMLVPLAFLPLVARGRAVLAVGLAACLLASRAAVLGAPFRYAALFVPFGVALAPAGVARLGHPSLPSLASLDPRRLRRALVAAVLVASALVSWKFGALVDNAVMKPGGSKVVRALLPAEKETLAWVRDVVGRVPGGASLAVTSKLGAHAADRKDVFVYPDRDGADYVLVDDTELRGPDLDKHQKAVARGDFTELGRRGRMALLKRKQAQP